MREQQQQKKLQVLSKIKLSLSFRNLSVTRQIILSPKNSQEFLASQVSCRRFP